MIAALLLAAAVMRVTCTIDPGAPFTLGTDGWREVERTPDHVTLEHDVPDVGPMPWHPCPIHNHVCGCTSACRCGAHP